MAFAPTQGFIMYRFVCVLLLAALSSTAWSQAFRDRFTAVTDRNFDGGGSVSRQFHLHTGAYRPQMTIYGTDQARELPTNPTVDFTQIQVRHSEGTSSFADYVSNDALLDGVVILHEGQLAFEAYPNMNPWERHFAWSVTKVLTSTALATLVRDGRVSMEAPVERYLPELKGTAWAGIEVQNIADMASGIACLDSDGYQDTSTCVYTMEESLGITAATGRRPDFLTHVKTMRRHRPAGTVNEYVSANTNVLGLIIEAVSDKPYAEFVQEQLWTPMGAEADGLITVNDNGFAYASGGLSARLRDVARFGQIFTDDKNLGILNDELVQAMQQGGVELGEVRREGLEKLFANDGPVRAAWQWDYVWDDGAMFKGGYDGQGLYVDPKRRLVVAWFGTGLNFSETVNSMLPISRQLAGALPGDTTENSSTSD